VATRTKKPDPEPTEAEARQARELAQALAEEKGARGKVRLQINKKAVEIPARAVPLIAAILEKVGAGESVEVRTIHETLSTTEAAEILNVSRPYIVKLLDRGLIPCVTTEGNHRRVRRADLLEFKRRQDAERRRLVSELAAEGQRLNREYRLGR
jgi:excisionase family DNA binding protein